MSKNLYNKNIKLSKKSSFDVLNNKKYLNNNFTRKINPKYINKEEKEPTEGLTPVPTFLLFIFGILIFWGGMYIANYSGDFRYDIYSPNWRTEAESKINSINSIEFDPIKHGKKMFSRQCQQCHQSSGEGIAGVYPTLVNSPWLLDDVVRPIKILLNGMNGKIIVLDKEYNGNMPSFGMWSNRDIASVLSYVRSEWGNNAEPIEEDLVFKIRSEIGNKVSPWEASQLLEVHPFS